jgi:hypothetical protein
LSIPNLLDAFTLYHKKCFNALFLFNYSTNFKIKRHLFCYTFYSESLK